MSAELLRYKVFSVSKKKDGAVWNSVGTAWSNRDGSINVHLNALPLDGVLHLRDAAPIDGGVRKHWVPGAGSLPVHVAEAPAIDENADAPLVHVLEGDVRHAGDTLCGLRDEDLAGDQAIAFVDAIKGTRYNCNPCLEEMCRTFPALRTIAPTKPKR